MIGGIRIFKSHVRVDSKSRWSLLLLLFRSYRVVLPSIALISLWFFDYILTENHTYELVLSNRTRSWMGMPNYVHINNVRYPENNDEHDNIDDHEDINDFEDINNFEDIDN